MEKVLAEDTTDMNTSVETAPDDSPSQPSRGDRASVTPPPRDEQIRGGTHTMVDDMQIATENDSVDHGISTPEELTTCSQRRAKRYSLRESVSSRPFPLDSVVQVELL